MVGIKKPATYTLNTNIEEWKSVIGHERFYEVSNLGHLKSFYTKTITPTEILNYKILKFKINQAGYHQTIIIRGNQRCTVLAHRLVAEAFLLNPNNYPVVNHLDGNKLNNCVDNLEWCTQGDNIRHAFKLGLMEGNKGEKNALSVLSSDQVQSIDYLLEQGHLNNKEIAAEFDIDPVTICDIKRGKTWGWLTGRAKKETRKGLTVELGQQIFDLAIEGKVYQRDVAKQFGISQTHVSEIKSGKMWPKLRKTYDEQLAQKVL